MFIYILLLLIPSSLGILWIPSTMAFLTSLQWCFAVVAVFLIAAASPCNSQNPVQIVDRALVCFNNRMIYANCEEAYRLNVQGTINVPPEATDTYCNGPCLDETKLMLNCIDGVLSSFLFYNKATVRDVMTTIDAACSDSNQRGNFDVASHIQDEYSDAHQIGFSIYTSVYIAMIAGGGLFL